MSDPWKLEKYVLLADEKYSIGRKDCHIQVNENAVSRKHVLLTTSAQINGDGNPSITLTDSSKFGTFVNGTKIQGKFELDSDADIYLGHESCKFRLEASPLLVTSSCVSNPVTKKRLTTCLQKLGGQMLPEWTDKCAYLVMDKITFTIKVVSALLHCRPIVTPEYFEKLLESRKSPKDPLISHESFVPEVGEPLLKGKGSLFLHDEKRKFIFQGKRFFTLSKKQFKRLHQVIKWAHGKLDLVAEGDSTLQSAALGQESIVLLPEPKDEASKTEGQRQFTESIKTFLKRNGLRMVKESEVGLAVFFKSLEKYCNRNASERFADEPTSYMSTCQPSMESSILNATQSQVIIPKNDLRQGNQACLDTSKDLSKTVLAGESQMSPAVKRRRSSTWDKSVVAESIETDYAETDLGMPFSKADESLDQKPTKRFKNSPDNFFAPKKKPVANDTIEHMEATDNKSQGFSSAVEAVTADKTNETKEETNHRTKAHRDIPQTIDNLIDEKPMLSTMDRNGISTKSMDVKDEENLKSISEDLPVPGFLSTADLSKVKVEVEDENQLPKSLVAIQFVSLLVRTAKKYQDVSIPDSNSKNFKKFRKASYPGKDRGIPRIVGGEDLIAYHKEDLSRSMTFAGLREQETRQDEEEKYLDRLFNFSNDPASKKRKLR